MGERLLVQARLPVDLVNAVDHLSIDWNVYRAGAIERLLREALERYARWSLDHAVSELAHAAEA